MVLTASGKLFLSWVGTLLDRVYQVYPIYYYPNAIHTGVLTLTNWPTGKILDVGADWGTTDPRTNVFSADTRYNLRTNDGANIFIRTEGPKSPSGQLHLRLIFETGSEKYYWMNNIVGKYAFIRLLFFVYGLVLMMYFVAIGVLTNVEKTANSSVLKIDAWNVSSLL